MLSHVHNLTRPNIKFAIAQKLLGLIGYRLPRLRREGSGRNGSARIYVYGAAAPHFQRDCRGLLQLDDSGQARALPDGRDEVFAAWLERGTAKQTIEEGDASTTLPEIALSRFLEPSSVTGLWTKLRGFQETSSKAMRT